ncbi:hypothetical protein ROA7450_03692 [Roseovarius albus]|uniref:Uncharacterized protein n=1 Tax=Roseovarius albus TaxID=1247867 RepID=A0A1X7A2E9_9RHOB|nr:hypothetical protein ROA7450_03692 [Roseovarius albus]
MNRDELNRELRHQAASWQAVALIYAAIIGAMIFSAMSIL